MANLMSTMQPENKTPNRIPATAAARGVLARCINRVVSDVI
jgi:hypothetical protein